MPETADFASGIQLAHYFAGGLGVVPEAVNGGLRCFQLIDDDFSFRVRQRNLPMSSIYRKLGESVSEFT